MPDKATTRRCAKCGETKPFSDFHLHRKTRSGFASRCKSCVNAGAVAYRAANRDDVIRRKREYRQAHPERIAEQNSKRYQANRDREIARRIRETKKARLVDPERVRLQGLIRVTVYQAIKRGKLIKPATCSACCRAGNITAAHHSYAREHWLDVTWLCRSCHSRWDWADPKWRKHE